MQSPTVVTELSTTVRVATRHDLPALARLLAQRFRGTAPMDDAAARLVSCGHTLVLSYVDGELAAAAHVHVAGTRGVLDLLLVDEDADREQLERRLIGVADAICVAHDCVLDVVPAFELRGAGCAAGELRSPSLGA